MKKLLLSLAVLCLILASCSGNQSAPLTDVIEKQDCEEQKKCCKGMTEEQKQICTDFKAKWDDWTNLANDVKQELISKRKECFDKKMEEMKEIESKMQIRKAEIEAQLANWDTLTLDEQKTFFDNFGECCKDKKECKHKEAE